MRMSDGQLRSMLLTEMLLDSCMLSVALVAQNAGGQCGIVPDSSGPLILIAEPRSKLL